MISLATLSQCFPHDGMPIGSVSGQIVDVVQGRIFYGTLYLEDGRIKSIEEDPSLEGRGLPTLLPGLVDAHVHIESSMLTPAAFAQKAVVHGTVATVSDPHEIANVLGLEGIRFMMENGDTVPFHFFFGASSCVPSSPFETSGAVLGVEAVTQLLSNPRILFLSEMMNYPGAIGGDPEVLAKINAAKAVGKPIDGHAPGVTGADLQQYISLGISTDHETYTYENALEKIALGMKIAIREGSAARNFETLVPLLAVHPEMVFFCSDDLHPDNLVEGHINLLVRRALAKGYPPMDVIRAATLNPVNHYHLPIGLMQEGDPATFIVVDNLTEFNIIQTFINGDCVAQKGVAFFEAEPVTQPLNTFIEAQYAPSHFEIIPPQGATRMRVIEAIDGQIVTGSTTVPLTGAPGTPVTADVAQDVLKLAVINRYNEAPVQVAFIKNVGLYRGAIASSVGHDSHNIIAVGVTDEALARVVNALVEAKGGLAVYDPSIDPLQGEPLQILKLPIAGIISTGEANQVAAQYKALNEAAWRLGSPLYSPYMTLSFMSLPVIPELKLTDLGLFDVNTFSFTDLFL